MSVTCTLLTFGFLTGAVNPEISYCWISLLCILSVCACVYVACIQPAWTDPLGGSWRTLWVD